MRARIEVEGKAFDVVLEPVVGSAGASVGGPARFVATVEGERFEVRVDRRGPGAVVAAGDAVHVVGPVDAPRGTVVVDGVARHVRVLEVHGAPGLPDGAAAAGGAVRPPMMGKVEAVHVQAGQQVAAGDLLFVLEAMKMRNEVRAPVAGRVAAVHVRPGATVGTDAVAVQIEP